ncbi:hypothetical protein SADUNF_Sadunf19G0019000 [Salix dunnii]|uniref:BURP domain-containing protein n=1 Tax=Salix dunnii TaxID=1413687 RepID=A0A835MKP7_9ROSI|nr:hypothetical protein SADUNF_Sadunf19G0019000 [Salix dunnii]
MSLATTCSLLLLFFLTLSLHINFSTAVNSIGVSRRTLAVATDTVTLPKKVATFLSSDISPPTEKYWYSRLPNTPLPKALGYLLQPGHYPSINTEFANDNVSVAFSVRSYKLYRFVEHEKAIKSSLPDSTIFYLYNDIHPGKRMRIRFTNSGTEVSFLPRLVAESIPFSSDKIPEILKYFALEVNSKEARVIRDEIGGCEDPNMEGEEKFCATSLESLIDFSVERLGRNVRVLSTDEGKKQEYTVSARARMIGDDKAAVCHKMSYPYAVHYCHVIADTEVYEVPLVGADSTKVKALTVCHLNTSAWSPDHMAFKVLKIKPGPAVCHFLDTTTSSLLRLFFLTLSLHINYSTAVNSIGVSRRTLAVAADTVPFPKKVATFLPSDISPPTEKYWYSRLPNTPLPKALEYLLQPGHYPSINTEFANENHEKAIKSSLPDSTIFYLYNDIHPGKRMRIRFTNSGTKVSFLPRQVAESIPFSSDKIPEILKYFALDVNSKEARIIRDEIGGCEDPNMEGEEKFCATSLESLIDFSVERLGRNVRVLSTDAGKKQEYTVSARARMIGDDKAAVCHKMRYPYAVHYCHVIADTEVYEVPLVGADGAKVKAVTVCHLNTSAWSPDHMAFQVLKIKPGPAVCHFLDSDTLIWVPAKY